MDRFSRMLKNKKVTINPKNKKDDKCFQYAITVTLNYKQIDNHPEQIYITPYINMYDFLSHKKDWNKLELNNKTVVLNALFIPYNARQKRPAYISKCNSDRDKQVILLMITDNKKWHYLFVNCLKE